MTIFTLGHAENYRSTLAAATDENPMVKQGPFLGEDGLQYWGGIAFETVEAAREWARENSPNWVCFELDGCWPDDVWFDDLHGFCRITRNLRILREAT